MKLNLSDVMTWLRRPRNILSVGAGLLVAGIVLFVLPVAGATSPGFFSDYHSLARAYENLQTSQHEGIACANCHVDERGKVVASFALAADFYVNLFRSEKSPAFVKFEKPARAACLSCHGTGWSMDVKRTSTIPHPAHLRVASETRECVTCHKWTAHQEADMQKHKKMPFSGVCVAYGCHVGTKTANECSSCHHVLSASAPRWKTEHPKVVLASGGNACMESCHEVQQCQLCHTTGKTPEFTGVATRTGLSELEAAHIAGDWAERHGAQAIKGQAVCMECHVSDSECRSCHETRPKSHGDEKTWIGRHSGIATAVDEPRCLTCHDVAWCAECHQKFKEMR